MLQFLGRIIAHCLQANIRVPSHPLGTNDTVPQVFIKGRCVVLRPQDWGTAAAPAATTVGKKKMVILPCSSFEHSARLIAAKD